VIGAEGSLIYMGVIHDPAKELIEWLRIYYQGWSINGNVLVAMEELGFAVAHNSVSVGIEIGRNTHHHVVVAFHSGADGGDERNCVIWT